MLAEYLIYSLRFYFVKLINPFHSTDLYSYSLETSEIQRFSDVFREY